MVEKVIENEANNIEVEEETEKVVEKADENVENKEETTKLEEKQVTTEVVKKSGKSDLEQKQVTTNGEKKVNEKTTTEVYPGKECECENNYRSVSRKRMADS
ncbi:uncharacterized protein LOC143239979 [Tachypleus tridentatus]|uniref:uncharacterized protein LOC143239979 n=1 Tax=Tachypleus tridentatus TaxID=6853 RepID=UPI003FD2AFB4